MRKVFIKLAKEAEHAQRMARLVLESERNSGVGCSSGKRATMNNSKAVETPE